MSSVEARNAGQVWRAFLFMGALRIQGGLAMATVGEIALHCNRSRPTVKKYMREAARQGFCHEVVMEGNVRVWVEDKDGQ